MRRAGIAPRTLDNPLYSFEEAEKIIRQVRLTQGQRLIRKRLLTLERMLHLKTYLSRTKQRLSSAHAGDLAQDALMPIVKDMEESPEKYPYLGEGDGCLPNQECYDSLDDNDDIEE